MEWPGRPLILKGLKGIEGLILDPTSKTSCLTLRETQINMKIISKWFKQSHQKGSKLQKWPSLHLYEFKRISKKELARTPSELLKSDVWGVRQTAILLGAAPLILLGAKESNRLLETNPGQKRCKRFIEFMYLLWSSKYVILSHFSSPFSRWKSFTMLNIGFDGLAPRSHVGKVCLDSSWTGNLGQCSWGKLVVVRTRTRPPHILQRQVTTIPRRKKTIARGVVLNKTNPIQLQNQWFELGFSGNSIIDESSYCRTLGLLCWKMIMLPITDLHSRPLDLECRLDSQQPPRWKSFYEHFRLSSNFRRKSASEFKLSEKVSFAMSLKTVLYPTPHAVTTRPWHSELPLTNKELPHTNNVIRGGSPHGTPRWHNKSVRGT